VDAEPGCAADTAEAIIENGWKMLKRGILRLSDPEVDDDDVPFIQGAVTAGQRARARVVGVKLFAIRQHLRRAAVKESKRAKDSGGASASV
jgi:divalent metal cation (Fe/Co/Zn/Cd) transporter